MTREYYDREIPPVNRASTGKQDAYWLLRAYLIQAIRQNWHVVLDASPEIALADANLRLFTYRNQHLSFQVHRPEDLDLFLEYAADREWSV